MQRETGRETEPAAARKRAEAERVRERQARPEQRDLVEEASVESFPASDPPAFTGVTVR